jgi:hypothetical protein
VADECEAVRRTIGVFLRWAERRQRTPDRTAGIAWLRAVSGRLEPERRVCVKACLAERLGSSDGEREALPTRQNVFEPLPASVLCALGVAGGLVRAHPGWLVFHVLEVSASAEVEPVRLMRRRCILGQGSRMVDAIGR